MCYQPILNKKVFVTGERVIVNLNQFTNVKDIKISWSARNTSYEHFGGSEGLQLSRPGLYSVHIFTNEACLAFEQFEVKEIQILDPGCFREQRSYPAITPPLQSTGRLPPRTSFKKTAGGCDCEAQASACPLKTIIIPDPDPPPRSPSPTNSSSSWMELSELLENNNDDNFSDLSDLV